MCLRRGWGVGGGGTFLPPPVFWQFRVISTSVAQTCRTRPGTASLGGNCFRSSPSDWRLLLPPPPAAAHGPPTVSGDAVAALLRPWMPRRGSRSVACLLLYPNTVSHPIPTHSPGRVCL